MGSTRRAFTAEYKANAVSLVLIDGRSVADVAKGIGLHEQTLRNWVNKEKAKQPEDTELSESEKKELERLRVEVSDLKMQLEFAKKAAAWFAKNQQ
jgi:transposase